MGSPFYFKAGYSGSHCFGFWRRSFIHRPDSWPGLIYRCHYCHSIGGVPYL